MTQIENLYYCPVSSLYLPFENRLKLIQIFEEYSRPISKKSNSKQYDFWNGITCYKSHLFQEENLLYPGPEIDCTKYLEKEISILEQLPLEIESISLWRNNKPVPGHNDAVVYRNQKIDFRFRFFLNSDVASFFIQKGSKKYLINESSKSNIFVFNNQNCLHGSDFFSSSKKILGIVRGKIKTDEFMKFIQREAEISSENCLYSKDFHE